MADKSNDLESSENSDPQLILGNYKQMMVRIQTPSNRQRFDRRYSPEYS